MAIRQRSRRAFIGITRQRHRRLRCRDRISPRTQRRNQRTSAPPHAGRSSTRCPSCLRRPATRRRPCRCRRHLRRQRRHRPSRTAAVCTTVCTTATCAAQNAFVAAQQPSLYACVATTRAAAVSTANAFVAAWQRSRRASVDNTRTTAAVGGWFFLGGCFSFAGPVCRSPPAVLRGARACRL